MDEILIFIGVIFVVSLTLSFFVARVKNQYKEWHKKKKGDDGERLVSSYLGGTIEGKQYLVNDIIVEDSNGNTSQIDHIFINKYGVWVIETKSWAGQIYGDLENKFWTQVLAYGHEKNKHYNPIKQNAMHIFRLKQKNNLGKYAPLFSVVVFTEADISNLYEQEVCSLCSLHSKVWSDMGVTLSVEQMEKYYHKLMDLRIDNLGREEEHLEKIEEKKQRIEENRCPYCGCKLVVIIGKNGKFYGCPNYPNCKYTKNID